MTDKKETSAEEQKPQQQPVDEAAEDAKPRRPKPIDKDSIEATVKQLFGDDCECIWGYTVYKKRKSLRIQFKILGKEVAFEIRDAIDYIAVAHTLVAIYGKVRARIIEEMAAGVAYSKELEHTNRVQQEKDRIAGRM